MTNLTDTLVETIDDLGIEIWPDFADEDANLIDGHVIWEQTDTIVEATLDTGSEVKPVVQLDIRSHDRLKTQQIKDEIMDALEDADLLYAHQGTEWYYDDDTDIRGTRVIIALKCDY